jgi:hypothetical protein
MVSQISLNACDHIIGWHIYLDFQFNLKLQAWTDSNADLHRWGVANYSLKSKEMEFCMVMKSQKKKRITSTYWYCYV